MSSVKISTRKLSKNSKIIKDIREIYRHRNLDFFPSNFSFKRPVLIPSSEILRKFSTILLCDFDFIICTSLLDKNSVDEDKNEYDIPILKEEILKLNGNVILFKDEFVEEIPFFSTEEDLLRNTANYLKNMHPEGIFEILNKETIERYVINTPFQDILYSCIDNSPTSYQNSNGKSIFEEYWDNLDTLHREGKITKGTLMINPLNNLEGEVVQKEGRIKVKGIQINRAMHGDEVYIENESKKIVGIHMRKSRILVGTLFDIRGNDSTKIGLVRPIDRRLPDVTVITSLGSEFLYRKVVLHVIEWEHFDENPRGVIFKILGENGKIEDEITAILEHFQIDYALNDPYITNSDNDLSKYLNCLDWSFFSVERAYKDIQNGRRDLRHLDICSIDPEGCTDIDDALHCSIYDDYIEVGVHIADVSFYVLPDSPLDVEARNRSTTVYFPDRRIDMLPAFLSSGLCSLLENQDRAAFSCVWKFDREYNVIGTEIFKSLIRSKKAFTYKEAYDRITDSSSQNLVTLLDIATKLRDKRFEAGALELSTQELTVSDGDVKISDHVPTHYLVEEFMLLANVTIASFIHKHNPEYSLLRKHPLPSAIELDIVDSTNSKTLNDSLKNLSPEQSTIVKRIITRSMQQALYFCSGESSDFYHYGLATDLYTHFTSPIRRYPDIIVHRTVEYILNDNTNGMLIDQLREVVNSKTCSKMNFRNRNAQNASRMVDAMFTLKAVEEKDLAGRVVTVKEDGIVVFIEEYGIEGFIKTERKFEVFEEIKVKINKDFDLYCLNRTIDIQLI